MKFWQSLAWCEPEQLVEVAKFAEEAGFEGVLNADHAVFPETVDAPYPYSADGKPPMAADSPYPDCWVSLAFMAAATTRLRLSTSVYVLPLRNPFEVAKAAGSLAIFSGNRFALGIGAGWMRCQLSSRNCVSIAARRAASRNLSRPLSGSPPVPIWIPSSAWVSKA